VVYVWLFSTPQLLGELTVGADGAFSGALPLIGVEVGEHTLQVSGVNLNGLVRTANLGVIVDAPDVTENLPSTGQSLGAVKWMIVMLGFGGMLLAARRRQVA
jgi:LPXTG-motif cell wall-anchored protein